MTEETKSTGHPLDRQNAIERAIQLEGPKDPDKFKMPDGRSLTEVREANQQAEDAEYQEEVKMLAERTREQSIAEYSKGGELVMTKAGNIIDVTEPVPSDDTVTLSKSRTTMEDIEEGAIKPLRERTGNSSSAPSGEVATPGGQSLGSLPGSPMSATPSTPGAVPSAPTSTPGSSSSPSSMTGK